MDLSNVFRKKKIKIYLLFLRAQEYYKLKQL